MSLIIYITENYWAWRAGKVKMFWFFKTALGRKSEDDLTSERSEHEALIMPKAPSSFAQAIVIAVSTPCHGNRSPLNNDFLPFLTASGSHLVTIQLIFGKLKRNFSHFEHEMIF
jgi:hypothetical protein